jgi:hypothetical protein
VRALALVVVVALPAGADTELGGRPALRLGAGYDDNLFLDAQPSGPDPAQIRSDAVFDVQPSLLGWIEARRHLFTLGVDYLERLTLQSGDLRDANVGAGWVSPRWGPVSISFGGRYEHWATSFYPEDTFDLGGVEPGLRLQLHDRVAIDVQYRFAARHYSDPARLGQLDLDQRARGALWARLASWLRVEAGYTFVHIGSSDQGAELDRHRAELWLELTPLAWLSFSAAYAIAPQHLPSALLDHGMGGGMSNRYAPRDDLVQWFDAVVVARPLRWLELSARYQLVDSRSSQAPGNYRRNQVVASLGVRWDFTRQFVSPRPLLPSVGPSAAAVLASAAAVPASSPSPLPSPEPEGRAVTFRHRAPPGRRVELVGDWNGWQPQPLVESSAGMYEGTYIVAPGRHEYSFRVDGGPSEPADATAWVPDGFGGRSAVLTVE